MISHHTGNSRNVPCTLFICIFRHQGEFAVVIDKAFRDQPLVLNASIKFERMEVAEINAAVGELVMELNHQRLIIWTDWTQRELRAISRLPLSNILQGIWPNSRTRQLRIGNIRRMQHNAGIERQ